MPAVTGRCYCGAVTILAAVPPETVAYCHCIDCKRVTGAPVAAFAAFSPDDLVISPDQGTPISHATGVKRWFCRACGSPLAATYDYLPDQIYVPIGLLDQAVELNPEIHAHFGCKLPWLLIEDDLEKHAGSARDALSDAHPPEVG